MAPQGGVLLSGRGQFRGPSPGAPCVHCHAGRLLYLSRRHVTFYDDYLWPPHHSLVYVEGGGGGIQRLSTQPLEFRNSYRWGKGNVGRG